MLLKDAIHLPLAGMFASREYWRNSSIPGRINDRIYLCETQSIGEIRTNKTLALMMSVDFGSMMIFAACARTRSFNLVSNCSLGVFGVVYLP